VEEPPKFHVRDQRECVGRGHSIGIREIKRRAGEKREEGTWIGQSEMRYLEVHRLWMVVVYTCEWPRKGRRTSMDSQCYLGRSEEWTLKKKFAKLRGGWIGRYEEDIMSKAIGWAVRPTRKRRDRSVGRRFHE